MDLWEKKVLIATINFNLETRLQQKTKRLLTYTKIIKYAFHVPVFCSPAQQSNREVRFSRSSFPCDLEAKNTSVSFLVLANDYSPKRELISDGAVSKRGKYPPLHTEVNSYFSILSKLRLHNIFRHYSCLLQLQMLVFQFEFVFRNTLSDFDVRLHSMYS